MPAAQLSAWAELKIKFAATEVRVGDGSCKPSRRATTVRCFPLVF